MEAPEVVDGGNKRRIVSLDSMREALQRAGFNNVVVSRRALEVKGLGLQTEAEARAWRKSVYAVLEGMTKPDWFLGKDFTWREEDSCRWCALPQRSRGCHAGNVDYVCRACENGVWRECQNRVTCERRKGSLCKNAHRRFYDRVVVSQFSRPKKKREKEEQKVFVAVSMEMLTARKRRDGVMGKLPLDLIVLILNMAFRGVNGGLVLKRRKARFD